MLLMVMGPPTPMATLLRVPTNLTKLLTPTTAQQLIPMLSVVLIDSPKVLVVGLPMLAGTVLGDTVARPRHTVPSVNLRLSLSLPANFRGYWVVSPELVGKGTCRARWGRVKRTARLAPALTDVRTIALACVFSDLVCDRFELLFSISMPRWVPPVYGLTVPLNALRGAAALLGAAPAAGLMKMLVTRAPALYSA